MVIVCILFSVDLVVFYFVSMNDFVEDVSKATSSGLLLCMVGSIDSAPDEQGFSFFMAFLHLVRKEPLWESSVNYGLSASYYLYLTPIVAKVRDVNASLTKNDFCRVYLCICRVSFRASICTTTSMKIFSWPFGDAVTRIFGDAEKTANVNLLVDKGCSFCWVYRLLAVTYYISGRRAELMRGSTNWCLSPFDEVPEMYYLTVFSRFFRGRS